MAIDGKTVRGPHDRSAGQESLHVMNAWAKHVNIRLGQISIDSKVNEIPAVRELLDILNLKGAIVTADAMHCQKATAKKIIEKEADYVLQVKDKQVRCYTKTERNRTRQETRTCIVGPAPTELREKWPGLQTIGLIHRLREHTDGTESAELSYFISSWLPGCGSMNVTCVITGA